MISFYKLTNIGFIFLNTINSSSNKLHLALCMNYYYEELLKTILSSFQFLGRATIAVQLSHHTS